MNFNPYAAGQKRYRGAGSAPNTGRTLDPTGFIDRSKTQQAAKRMQQQQGVGPQPSQERSGLAQQALQRSSAGGAPQPPQPSQMSAQQPMAPVPQPPPIHEPSPTWNLPAPISTVSGMGANIQDQEFQGPSLPGERIPAPPIDAPGVPPPPPLDVGPPVATAMADAQFTPRTDFTAMSAAGGTGSNNIGVVPSAPPQFTPNAPTINFPDLPKFGDGSTTLDRDLRAEREGGYANLTNQLIEISNLVQDLQSQYMKDAQGQSKSAEELFRGLVNNYAGRGMLGASAYGQDFISNTEDVTRSRNELDEWLGRGQRDALQSRSSAVQNFQNMLNQLLGTQGMRDAERRVQEILGRSSGGGGGTGSGGSGGGSTIKKWASSNPNVSPAEWQKRLEDHRKRNIQPLANPMGWN